jgi:RNA polymerase sigma-70 factor, ECF subfamily
MDQGAQITRLLNAWSGGDSSALDKVLPVVYAELHRLADSYLRREKAVITLQPTALVNEAVARLLDTPLPSWESRLQLVGICARLMRQILVDGARRRHALKRPQAAQRVDIAGLEIGFEQDDVDIEALDNALTRLADLRPRQAKVVELKFFGGLTLTEIANALEISEPTVTREWRLAKAWLRRAMEQ